MNMDIRILDTIRETDGYFLNMIMLYGNMPRSICLRLETQQIYHLSLILIFIILSEESAERKLSEKYRK